MRTTTCKDLEYIILGRAKWLKCMRLGTTWLFSVDQIYQIVWCRASYNIHPELSRGKWD